MIGDGEASCASDRDSLAADLHALGPVHGNAMLVHASLRAVGPVRGGAAEVVAALRASLGPRGTLVVPTFTADNSPVRYAALTNRHVFRDLRAIRGEMPPFDPATTPSSGMGRIAEEVRTHPESVRSAHPQTSFAAVGHHARALMNRHRDDCHLGEDSPLARLYQGDALILLLGVGFAVCSAFHLAEYRVPDPPRRVYECAVQRAGKAAWWAYEDVVLDDSDFAALGRALEETTMFGQAVVARGRVGSAECRLLRLRHAVDFAVEWMAHHRASAKSRRAL